MKDDTPFVIECPDCETRYEIPISIPEGGRKVRCAKCEHIWTVQPGDEIPANDLPVLEEDDEISFREPVEDSGQPSDEITPVDPSALEGDEEVSFREPVAAEEDTVAQEEPDAGEKETGEPLVAPPVEEAVDDQPETEQDSPGEEGSPGEEDATALADDTEDTGDDASMDDGSARDAVADFYGDDGKVDTPAGAEKIYIGKARRRGSLSAGLAAGWAMLCLGIAAAGYFAISQRVEVVRALPGSAWVYELIGMPVNVRGLDFADVAYSWGSSANRVFLEVHGDIVNVTDKTMGVPSVVFALRGEKDSDVFQWEYQVVNEPLAAGERATFAVRIPTPPKSTKAVQVRFAKAR